MANKYKKVDPYVCIADVHLTIKHFQMKGTVDDNNSKSLTVDLLCNQLNNIRYVCS